MKTKSLAFLIAPIVLTSATAVAQSPATTKFVPSEGELKVEKIDNIEARNRLDGKLAASANINLVHNKDMVGQLDGLSTIFGVNVTAGLDWIHGRHELRNTLSIDESFAKTPVLDSFVKNNDLVTLSSQYNYFFLDWMGAFGRLNFQTSLFPTKDYRNAKFNYYTTDLHGTRNPTPSVDNTYTLAGAFKPFSMAQSIGIVSDPLTMDFLNLSARLGVGGRETFAKGVYNITKVSGSDIELQELDNVFQFGLEGFVGGNGKFQGGRITYDFGVSVLIPLANNAPEVNNKKPSAFSLTRVGAGGSINVGIFSWMGLSYKLFILRDPQLLDKVQMQNTVLATFNYTFIDRDYSKDATASEVAVEQAKEEKEAAQKRADELEQKLKESEERAQKAEAAAKAAEATATQDVKAEEKAAAAANAAENQVKEDEKAAPSEKPAAEKTTPPATPSK